MKKKCRWFGVGGALVCGWTLSVTGGEIHDFAARLDESFGIGGGQSVIGASDCGLVNGYVTLNGWIEDVATVKSIWAPPYFCADFVLRLSFNGEDPKATGYFWRPEALVREGTVPGWKLKSRLVPIVRSRGAILEIDVENVSGAEATLEIRQNVTGTVKSQETWGFGKPKGDGKRKAKLSVGSTAGEVARLTDVRAGERRKVFYAVAIGEADEADGLVAKAVAAPEGTVAAAVADWRERVRWLAEKMPRFESDDPRLVRLYDRSLLHLLMVEWNSDWFVVKPYYATGGLAGGCLCNYLWNFGGPHRLWPLLDPDALKAHLKTFLALDLTNCYAFAPADGAPLGPYYPINQEKILFLIDSYVRETGDVAFLKETFRGKTMVEWAVAQALVHDDLTKPAVLHDYGAAGKSHLELRKQYRYDGVMPDLNLRRVALLHMADRLCRMAGHDPKVDLVARAAALKRLVREKLWDADVGWFRAICSDGQPTIRWTMQMFKALGWGRLALDADVEDALVRHLMNPKEFLGDYGVHSLSKLDVAYDVNDVDNGGPGACPSFAPAICDRLYRDGRFAEANEIFMRLRWLGESLPYLGDSQYADRRDYRRDTPLQCDVEGACLAQTILFGMFGVGIGDDLAVRFDPHLPTGVNRIALGNFRLVGKAYDVEYTRAGGLTVKEVN